MSSEYTYTSVFFIPGRRAGNVRQIVNDSPSCDKATGITSKCPSPINSKIVKNSNSDVIPGTTQRERAVNAIRFGRGGKVIFGNPVVLPSGKIVYPNNNIASNINILNSYFQPKTGKVPQMYPVCPFVSRNKF
jgi:hypothetical protein